MLSKGYAKFSVKHPWFHRMNVTVVAFIFLLSCYQLLVNEAFEFSIGFVVTLLATLLFASASAFKKRYSGFES
ncbi:MULTISPECIES: hypothetical protein [Vibrio]|uniref:Uncharacterized protein n=2 Tax=Vibrio campbellii TaxID=680 RepID=A0ACC7R8P1_9VIBR|nr:MULTISPECIES: hypothetical protein [Vibrio]APX08454.1 hypothetical protein BWP24_19885 [Vibrio campbellii]ARR47692.1 hypothetical protein CAY59_26345 [Vibrio campbellii]AUV88773.1 hypothetical protein C1N50_21795 [Vibrio campbellii]AUW06469.1 hypothetical protein C1N51_22815 [Vibrio campbellii]MCC8255091.1 hypothetical protein [Vibrio campbellii CAIM 333]